MIHMSKKCALSFLLAVVMLLTSTVAFAVTGTVTPNALILRKEASTDSKALQTLPKGTKLEIEYKEGSWYKVTYGKYEGYVYASYVKVDGTVPQKGQSSSSSTDDSLEKGDKGEAVKELQRRLKELGYYSSSIDGSYGDVTVSAVKAFQKKNGLTADGVAGPVTQKKLQSSSAISANGSTSSDSAASGTLKKGDKGEAVKELQRRLKELGYYSYGIDGDYGTRTFEAVKAFQKKNGLVVDGQAGDQTMKRLNSSAAISANGSSNTEDDKEEETTSSTLKRGASGAAVKLLQNRLKELGFYTSYVDGDYGYQTEKAVKAFQSKNGLTADGVAGTDTLKKLNSDSAIDVNGRSEDEEDDGTLKKGSTGTAVKNLQKRLRELGYYDRTCDGDYGDVTVKAVKAFQKNNGLTVDGVAGPSTLNKLNSSSAVDANGKTAQDKDEEDDGTLKKGASGEKVKELQKRLKELGYYTAYVDGDYGDATVKAVKSFQSKNGLDADGVAGDATLRKLDSDSVIKANGYAADALDPSVTMKKGDSGAVVKALQKRLKELGYYTDYVDGDYGLATSTAVSDFQRANGLTVNGNANSATIKKLLSDKAVSKDEADQGGDEDDGETYVTERLDWFKDGQDLFRRKDIIKVKDVRTGLVFNAQVLYGTNHLDAEPLTAADTAILLRINGGVEFKYYRRPMLVQYNGHVYAASIYSEPHGDQTIYDNNFEGQFCLHFYGSMTHGSDKVDADHQECVAQAMNATW